MAHVLRDDMLFTVVTDSADHRFEVDIRDYYEPSTDTETTRCTCYYEETHVDGEFIVLPKGPREAVWDDLCGSEEFLRFMKQHDVDTFRRGD